MVLTNLCINCTKKISNRFDLCAECTFNPEIMISQSEAKQKYKLTDDDLEDSNLFYICFKIHGNIGTKYLREDIHELATKLAKDDKRKKALQKQQEYLEPIMKKKKEIKERKKLINTHVEEYLTKLEIRYKIDEHPNIYILIDECSKDLDKSALLASNYIINEIENEVDRIIELENFMKKNINEKYHKDCKSIKYYKDYILGCNTDLKKTKEGILTHVDFIIAKEQRKEQLDKLIEENIDKKYYEKVISYNTYNNFVNHNIGKLDNCFKKIVDNLENEIDLKLRKSKMNYRIKKYIPKNYQEFAKSYKIYNNYINSGKSVYVENIFNQLQNVVNRKIKIDNSIKKNRLKEEVTNNICYKLYIDGAKNYKETTLTLKKNHNRLIRKKAIDNFCHTFYRYNLGIAKQDPNYKLFIETKHISLEEFGNIIDNKTKRCKFISNIPYLPNKSKPAKKYINGEINKKEFKKRFNQSIYRKTYDNKWDDWLREANLKINFKNINLNTIHEIDKKLFDFMDNDEISEMLYPDLNNRQREFVHNRCDQLNLIHNSFYENDKRIIRISKPIN